MTTATAHVENRVEKTGGKTGVIELEPQKHGGALKRGGPSPGSGRRPAKIKRIAQQAVAERLPLLMAWADGVAVSLTPSDSEKQKLITHAVEVKDRIAALKELGKLAGLSEEQKVPVSTVRQRLIAQAQVLRDELDAETFTRVAERLEAVWR